MPGLPFDLLSLANEETTKCTSVISTVSSCFMSRGLLIHASNASKNSFINVKLFVNIIYIIKAKSNFVGKIVSLSNCYISLLVNLWINL